MSSMTYQRDDERSFPSKSQLQIAAWCALASGISAVIGIGFMVAFFTIGGIYGPLNDIAVIVQYLFMLPIAFTIYALLGSADRNQNRLTLVLGILGMLAVILLQTLLVARVLPFNQQIIMVIPAFLAVLAWFLMVEQQGRSEERLPKSKLLYVFAGLYIGYPVWAFSLWRRLRDDQ